MRTSKKYFLELKHSRVGPWNVLRKLSLEVKLRSQQKIKAEKNIIF